MTRIAINSNMLRWARERADLTAEELVGYFPLFMFWERGEKYPTLNQLEHFSKIVHVPIGYLFLTQPPVELIPIPDFRTTRNTHKLRPSPDLLETMYLCQQRQEWYHNYALSMGEAPLSFVGSATPKNNVIEIANEIRAMLGFDIEERTKMPTWTDALRHFIDQADTLGILVMCSGVVGNNTHRHLNPDEFRGFALSDLYAPLIFINGADTKAAQMFTLAHELAHIWIGQSAVSDSQAPLKPDQEVEVWCNQVAAECLVPITLFRKLYNQDADIKEEINRLARYFKVSTLVILRRIHDIGVITREELWELHNHELTRLMEYPRSSGGNFYFTETARVSKRFARALVVSTLEGQTLHRDAFRMLGFSKLETFHELGRSLGVMS